MVVGMSLCVSVLLAPVGVSGREATNDVAVILICKTKSLLLVNVSCLEASLFSEHAV